MTETWTCRCRQAQLQLREVRLFPKPDGGEDPKWIYGCPQCTSEAVAWSSGIGGAPVLGWLTPAGEDDTDFGGRVATGPELMELGDVLADNPARDERGKRVVWQR